MQNEGRRRIAVPKRGIGQRYPRTVILVGTTLAMCVLFSKPIYDIFFFKPSADRKKIALSDRV